MLKCGLAPTLDIEISQFAVSTITYNAALHINCLGGRTGARAVKGCVHIQEYITQNCCNKEIIKETFISINVQFILF